MGSSSFRNYQVAAPLKLEEAPVVLGVHLLLPQLSSCGPIEASRLSRAVKSVPSFRNYQVAAPLKLKLVVTLHGNQQPSATIKLRPH